MSKFHGSQLYFRKTKATSSLEIDPKCHQKGKLEKVTFATSFHQEFQVSKIEVLNLIFGYLGVDFPLHKPYIQLI